MMPSNDANEKRMRLISNAKQNANCDLPPGISEHSCITKNKARNKGLITFFAYREKKRQRKERGKKERKIIRLQICIYKGLSNLQKKCVLGIKNFSENSVLCLRDRDVRESRPSRARFVSSTSSISVMFTSRSLRDL